jgi:hypothetical protein
MEAGFENDKPIYVTLETLMLGDSGEHEVLIRALSPDYLGKSFGDVLEKMADTNTDEYQLQPYNMKENVLANNVKEFLNTANRKPKDVQLVAYSTDDAPEKLKISLEETVADYTPRILGAASKEVNGEQIPYRKIHLRLTKGIGGGSGSYLGHCRQYSGD